MQQGMDSDSIQVCARCFYWNAVNHVYLFTYVHPELKNGNIQHPHLGVFDLLRNTVSPWEIVFHEIPNEVLFIR